jgi:signal transduction histidine kinase
LANLLDGSMRNVSLVVHTLRDIAAAPVQTTPGQDDNLVQRLESVSAAMQQMAELVHHLIGHTGAPHKLSTTAQGQHAAPTLGQLLHHAASLLRPMALSRGVKIDVLVDERAATLAAPPIYPVIANALRNSIEAIVTSGATSGLIQLRAAADAKALTISVTDDGPGFNAALFDARGRFRFGRSTKQSSRTSSSERDKRGLGLSLSREIAQSLGGTLKLTQAQLRGAAMTLQIPLHEPSSHTNPVASRKH